MVASDCRMKRFWLLLIVSCLQCTEGKVYMCVCVYLSFFLDAVEMKSIYSCNLKATTKI